MSDDRIMCAEDFEVCFNIRIAEKCCANCKYGDCECEGEATCRHPKRNDNGGLGDGLSLPYYYYNVLQHQVCDLWEAKGETK